MHALAPLLFILIVFNGEQVKQDKLYRANVFSLVGICYFVMLQYTMYWFRVFPTQSPIQYLPGVIFVLATVALLFTPWLKKSRLIKTAICVSIFAISICLTFTMDHLIKEKLAEVGGFFSLSESVDQIKQEEGVGRFVELPKIGVGLKVPADWVIKVASSGHSFFESFESDKKVLEVRPNCLGQFELDTPSYIHNILNFYEVNTLGEQYSYQCNQAKNVKECLVKVAYSEGHSLREKWHWFRLTGDRSRSFSMDILSFNGSLSGNQQVRHLIQSAAALKQAPTEYCRTPSAWL